MTTTTADTEIRAQVEPRAEKRVSPVWLVLAVLVGLFSLFHDGVRIWEKARGDPDRGTLGAVLGDYCRTDGFCVLREVQPGGPLAAAGAREGDAIRFDRPVDSLRAWRVGETASFTLKSEAGVVSHRQATTVAGPAPSAARILSAHLTNVMWMATGLAGLFVLVRSGRRPTVFLLGAGLACLGLSGTFPSVLESDPRFFPAWMTFAFVVFSSTPVLFLAFARSARLDVDERGRGFWTAVLALFAIVQAALCGYGLWTSLDARILPGIGDALLATAIVTDLCYALSVLALAGAWRAARGEARMRLALLLVATALLTGAQNGVGLAINMTGNDWSLGNPLVWALLIGSLAGTLVLAYAILRHRVVDLGFAVNRTLVYGVLSAGLLVAFGLIEWAVEHFLPINSHETGVVLDAGLALGLFLVFHRVRDVIEHAVEGVFFRKWRSNEAELNRFVREAGFVTQASALVEATVAALGRFAGGAPVAVYAAEADGYALVGGGLPG
ncbi:hypothetical protein, partial [Caulobacter sp. 17J65-9]|uniref:hypothetical protein n=1 Tax=Caulobacter sp. 17J65-9 TaxID=2709382 RepID=UPI0013C59CC0